MLSVITSGSRYRALQRPAPPYTVNLGSWQAQGLVAFWPLGQSSTNALHAPVARGAWRLTQNGTMTLGQGPDGPGFAVSNTGNAANWLSLSTAPVTAVPSTLACWALPATTTVAYNLLLVGEGTNGNYWVISMNYSTQARCAAITGSVGDAVAETTTNFSAGQWSHVCGVFGAANARAVYWNGTAKGTNTSSLTPSGVNSTNLGGYRLGGTTYGALNGRMAHACIWNRALSDTEVAMLYDPQWRWDLYYPLGRRFISFAPAAPAGTKGPPPARRPGRGVGGARCVGWIPSRFRPR
jgi:hypothetical protein